MYLAESNHRHSGNSSPLAVLKANPDGGGIVQAIGPLKVLATHDANPPMSQRFLIVTSIKDSSDVVMWQVKAASNREQQTQ